MWNMVKCKKRIQFNYLEIVEKKLLNIGRMCRREYYENK